MDGVVRDALTVNQQVIGPTIEATVGDNLLITVTNRCMMQEVVSMHWHGIRQKETPWADGAAFVTNCPLTFGTSYTYNFTVDAPGTYWYHIHAGSLREEGANGLLIVYSQPSSDPTDLVQSTSQFGTLQYDDEIHVILSDRYAKSVYTLNAMMDNNPFMKVGSPDMIYVNGKSESKDCSYNVTTTTVTTTSTDGASTTITTTCKGQREIFALERNKTYLVRVVNAAFLSFFNLAIAGHYFTIVGVDGDSYTTPVDVHSLDLSAGQRIMALLRYDDTSVDASTTKTYVMQAQTDWGGVVNTHAGIVHAYVTYSNPVNINTKAISPLVPPNESRNWHAWYDLVTPHPDTVNDSPNANEVTKRFQIDGKIQYVDTRTGTGLSPPTLVGGAPNTRESWTDAAVLSIVKKRTSTVGQPNAASSSAMEMTPALHPLRIELNDVVEIVVQAYASGSGGCDLHPWHLHGHSFWLVSRGDGLYNATTGTGDGQAAAINTYTSARPLKMDTVSGYPARFSDTRAGKSRGVWNDPCGWFVVRFRADNPGMWLFHCHIGWHMEMGMALVFDEASEMIPPPSADYGMCGAAGEVGNIATLFKETAVVHESSDQEYPNSHQEFKHGATYQVLVAFLVLLAVVASGAAIGLFCMWQKVKNVRFERINPHSQHTDEIENPLSAHGLQHNDQYSPVSSRVQSSQSSNFEELSEIDDELEEIDFNHHSQHGRKKLAFQPMQVEKV
eukprot:gene11483-13349_t